MTAAFPLSAIVGQEDLVTALVVNAVSPAVGGVLVRGERGTAKSTAVRALAPLLPAVRAADGQPLAFAPGDLAPGGPVAQDAPWAERPAPLVELPVGATADRLVGALDLGRALEERRHAVEPGLLARAHQGVLYVDEVNLLPDHLVDLLLDAAATGVCRVEREAVSVVHDARFLLVGTMNPEEGELRPQLTDRFGLGVEVWAPAEPAERAEIVRRRLAFEADAEGFVAAHAPAERRLAERIAAARERLPGVRLPDALLLRIAGACARLGVDGVRGDIVTARTARALAAIDGVDEVGEDHVLRAAALALAHRRRRDPLGGDRPLDPQALREALAPEDDGGGDDGPPDDPPDGPGDAPERRDAPDGRAPARERRDAPGRERAPIGLVPGGRGEGPAGRRAASAGPGAGAVDTRPARPGATDLAPVATLRAGLVAGDGCAVPREHVRSGRESCLLVLVLDASGSMGARRRMRAVKASVLALLRDAYARRDRVALVAFRDDRAEVVARPGTPLPAVAAVVADLPTGGCTPLAAGLDAATALIRAERRREPGRRAVCAVVTDGRAQDAAGTLAAGARLGAACDALWVLDAEDGPVRLGGASALAAAAGGQVRALAEEGGVSEPPPVDGPLERHAEGVDLPHRPGDRGSAEPARRRPRDRPLVVVVTGDGKGKSTSAFGMLMRSWARGHRCGVFQFVKSPKWKVGERRAAEALGGIDWECMGDGWSWLSRDLEESADLARAGWEEVRRAIAAERYEFLILDEVTYPINWGWIDLAEVVQTLRDRPGFQHVVLTGRRAPDALIEAADLVSRVEKVKHPLDAGIRAQQGIEW